MSTVTVHIHTPTKSNLYKLALIYDLNGGGWERILQKRKINPAPIAMRKMTEREQEADHKSTRLFMVKYNNWKDLIDDERIETENEDWIALLRNLSELQTT